MRAIRRKDQAPGQGQQRHESGTITYELPQLTQDTNYGICIEMLEDGMRYCENPCLSPSHFSRTPTVARCPTCRLTGCEIDRRGKKVAVFGVVDPNIQNRMDASITVGTTTTSNMKLLFGSPIRGKLCSRP